MTWSYLDEENTGWAAEFIADWSRGSKCCGIPARLAGIAMVEQYQHRLKHGSADVTSVARHLAALLAG